MADAVNLAAEFAPPESTTDAPASTNLSSEFTSPDTKTPENAPLISKEQWDQADTNTSGDVSVGRLTLKAGRLKAILEHPWDKYVKSVDEGFKGIDIPRVTADAGTDVVSRAGQVGAAATNIVTSVVGGAVSPGGALAILNPTTALYSVPRFVAGGVENIIDAVKGAYSGKMGLQDVVEKGVGGTLMLAGGVHGARVIGGRALGLDAAEAPKSPEQAIGALQAEAAKTADPQAKAALEAAAIKVSDTAKKGNPILATEFSPPDKATTLEDQSQLQRDNAYIQTRLAELEVKHGPRERFNPETNRMEPIRNLTTEETNLLKQQNAEPTPAEVKPIKVVPDLNAPAEVAPVEVPPAPVTSPEIQYTIQQPDPHPMTGAPTPPWVQIESKTNQGRGEPMPADQKANFPSETDALASGLPTGQYTLDEVKAAIDKNNAPEPLPTGATATKNEQVDVERASRGLPPAMQAAAKDFPKVWDEANKTIDENPSVASNLVAELKAKPRAVTDVENAILLHQQIDLHNEFDRVSQRINDPATDPAVAAEDRVRFAKLSDDLLDLYNVDKQVGTETGRGLNARKMLANEDFSLASMVTERRAAKGGRELTPQEISDTEALHQQITATQKAFDDYRSRMSDLLMSEDTPKARKAATSSFVQSLSDRADAARNRIKARMASGQVSSGIDPGLLKDYAEVGAYHIARGIENLGKWSAEMVKEFGDKIQPHLQAIFNAAKQRHADLEAQDPRLKAFKTRKANQTSELQAKTAAGDFSSKAPPKPLALDEEALRLKTENERAKQAYQEALIKDRLANRTTFQKAQDTLVKWRRGFLLSGPVTLAKLTSAAVQRMVITPVEEAVGGGIGKMIPRVAEKAPREGGLNVTAESKAITEGLTKGMQDAWDLLKTGKSSLEVLFGKGRDGAIRESDVTPRSIIDFFGQIHGALKSPVKRAEFARSLEKRMAFAIKNGVDVSDPMVQTRLMVEAYKDGNRSIFLQDNVVVDAWNRAITALSENKKSLGGKPSTAGKMVATIMKVLAPIVRVPTNIVAETIQYATGTVTGSARLAAIMRRGTDNLSPEQADLVMRELKKGSLGAAVLLMGYLNADKVGGYYQSNQKRGKNDVAFGSMRVFGHDVPSYLMHNPLLEVVQLGATIRRVAEAKLSKKDHGPQGLASGVWAGALGLIEEVPFVRQQVETAKMIDTREGPTARGRFVKGLVVPAAVDFAARKLDTDAKGNPVNRNPKTILQHVETGIPGLRETVPAKR